MTHPPSPPPVKRRRSIPFVLLVSLGVALMLFEQYLWRGLKALMAGLGRLPVVARLESGIAALPPRHRPGRQLGMNRLPPEPAFDLFRNGRLGGCASNRGPGREPRRAVLCTAAGSGRRVQRQAGTFRSRFTRTGCSNRKPPSGAGWASRAKRWRISASRVTNRASRSPLAEMIRSRKSS